MRVRVPAKPRKKVGYKVKRTDNGACPVYVLSHGEIKPGGKRGIWQLDFYEYRNRRVPHIFFTCPHCGAINRDYMSEGELAHRVENDGSWRSIRYCHNCRACRRQIPYSIQGGAKKIHEVFRKFRKSVLQN